MNKVLAVIPARRASTRLPDKPLKLIGGKRLLERVYGLALRAKLVSRLVIATDDEDIFRMARDLGAEVIMTSVDCATGTERVAAARAALGDGDWDAVVNIQGDMPFLEPSLIDATISLLTTPRSHGAPPFEMTTLATPIFDQQSFTSASTVKVVVSELSQALYFSRAPIPHSRDGVRPVLSGRDAAQAVGPTVFGLKHIGLYVFSPSVLRFFVESKATMLEGVEMLEQLRALEAGFRIGVFQADPDLTKFSLEIDTPADLERAQKIALEFDAKLG